MAQVVGAVLAAWFLQLMYRGILDGATEPSKGVSPWVAMLTGAVLTLGLVSVILSTSGARNVGINGAIAVGAYIGLVSVWGPSVRGVDEPGSFVRPGAGRRQPHRLLDLLVGPIIGALIAVGFEVILKGKPTKAGAEAAQGILDENPQGL